MTFGGQLIAGFFVLTIHMNNFIMEDAKPELKYHYCQPDDAVQVPDYMESNWAYVVDEVQDTQCSRDFKEILINIHSSEGVQ